MAQRKSPDVAIIGAGSAAALVATVDQLAPYKTNLVRWLDRQGADVAVFRPDRYVLAAGSDLDAVTAEVRDLLEPQPTRAPI